METFAVFSQDEEPLIDALPQNISAEIVPLTVGALHTDYFKLVVSDGKYSFVAGLYRKHSEADKNLKSLMKAVKKARQGKSKFTGWQVAFPSDGEITALEILAELEYSARCKKSFLDVAERIFDEELDGDEEIPF